MGRELGGGFRMEGTPVYLWPTHTDGWQKPSQYCNYPPIKTNNFFLKPIMFRIQNSARLDFSKWRRCYVTIPPTKGTLEVSHLYGELFTFSCVRVHISLG